MGKRRIVKRQAARSAKHNPLVGIVMGSDSDLSCMKDALEALRHFEIACEIRVVSAHRTPDVMFEYAKTAKSRGLRVIIAGAGGAAHLPGMIASITELPVIGVPVPIGHLNGQDALYSIVQMPKGIPVATVAIGNAWNAGLLAAQILGCSDQGLQQKIREYKSSLHALVRKKDASLLK